MALATHPALSVVVFMSVAIAKISLTNGTIVPYTNKRKPRSTSYPNKSYKYKEATG